MYSQYFVMTVSQPATKEEDVCRIIIIIFLPHQKSCGSHTVAMERVYVTVRFLLFLFCPSGNLKSGRF